MQTTGFLSPERGDEVADLAAEVGPAAQVVVRETAKAMEFDREEYDDRVSTDVVLTARDALFASLLEVHVGTSEEFEAWTDEFDGEVVETGNENVDNVVWHAFDGTAVAATFQDEEDAAVATLRRQAFGRLYDDLV